MVKTKMDITAYRQSKAEQERNESLISLLPLKGETCLEIGTRDGFFAMQIADRFSAVSALDLEKPNIPHPNIKCIQGNVVDLQFADNSFDHVVCAEVLEHVPEFNLEKACSEIARVTRSTAVIGVPYRQDLRVSRTTCLKCGNINPPWGHVNSFDEKRLIALFKGLKVERIEYIGVSLDVTNWVSTRLYDFAGNPFGTYEQEEPCIHCGARLLPPLSGSLSQRVASKVAHTLNRLQQIITPPHFNWIHILFEKARTPDCYQDSS